MQKQKLQQQQQLKLSPQQIQFLNLLQIPLALLEKRMQEEIEENPTLEEIEETDEDFNITSYYKNSNSENYSILVPNKDDSLYDTLNKQLILQNLEEKEYNLAKYLIGCLDENGLLNQDLFSISNDLLINETLEVTEEELEKALFRVQTLEPIGVGARTLQECLLIQLKSKPNRKSVKTARAILDDHYNDFSKKNFEAIIKQTNFNKKEIKDAYVEVEKLTPKPGNVFNNSFEVNNYIIPDFNISSIDGVLNMKLNASNKRLYVNNKYEKMLKETKDKETIEFITRKIETGRWFVNALKQREETLKSVMNVILGFQKEYFMSGKEKDLKPMKLIDIAKPAGLDISTISRVTNSKYVETSFGTFLLKELFSEAYKKVDGTSISTKEIKAALSNIIENEDKTKPLTDEKLTKLVGENEYFISRRTVTKYRKQLKYPTARLRREL